MFKHNKPEDIKNKQHIKTAYTFVENEAGD
jgi:hypothetical protein